jgi:glyoxylase-like metal-dependent hydrolase (beta-lactamase superfamily II)
MTVLVEDAVVRISRLRLGPWETNAYVVMCSTTKASLVVDAPAEAAAIIGELKGSTPKYVLLTHNHLDHVGALAELRNKLKVPLGCHPLDASELESPPEVSLRGGEELALGKLRVAVIHTPGHTRGSLCFRLGSYLISGDTIFPGGPGNTRSSGDFKEIVRSIKDKVFALPDDTKVFPGHGEPTILGNEKEQFAVFARRPQSPDLHGDVIWLGSEKG